LQSKNLKNIKIMGSIIFVFIVMVLNLLVGIYGIKDENYKRSAFNFFVAGALFVVLLNLLK
jgi:hypothetical protein